MPSAMACRFFCCASWAETAPALFRRGEPGALFLVLVLGVIYGVIFTPTEAVVIEPRRRARSIGFFVEPNA